MSWGTRKRNFIITIFLTVFVIVCGAIAFLFFYEEPTCFDSKQNGFETGIDCGGTCQLLCTNATLPPTVHWVRFFNIADGLYSVIAYVENQNVNAAVKNVPYTFKLFDDNGVILAEKSGFTDLRPRQIIPITETGLSTGKLFPNRVTFDFDSEIVWQKQEKTDPILIIKDEEISFDKEVQKITAEIYNSSLETVKDITFIVIVYDKKNNAIASSSTFVNQIEGDRTANIIFTWPTSFADQVSRFEIIPLYE